LFSLRGIAAACAVVGVVVACGGGGDSVVPQDGSVPLQITGSVLSPNSAELEVFLDLNNDQVWSQGEPIAAVAKDGSFTLDAGRRNQAEIATATLVTRSKDRAQAPMSAPADAFVTLDEAGRQSVKPAVVSPLTTLVAAEVRWNGLTAQQASQAVRSDLGLGEADVLSDYVRKGDAALSHAADVASDLIAQAQTEAGVLKQSAALSHMRRGGSTRAKNMKRSGDGTTRFVVKLADSATNAMELGQFAASTHGGILHHVVSHSAKGFAVTIPDTQAEAFLTDMAAQASVERIDADEPFQAAAAVQTKAPWNLDRIDQRYLPLNQTYSYLATGRGVNVYVVDTGIRSTHDQFGRRVSPGFTAIADSWGAADCNGHGTHVAGTIGGATWGVAKDAHLVPVRVLDCSGAGYSSTVAAGLDWVGAHAFGPSVVILAVDGPASSLINASLRNLASRGITVIGSAGNSGDNACNFTPASEPSILAVGATSRDDKRASFSNTGSCVGLFAPGVAIQSAYWNSDSSAAELSGTSMAAAHAAGIAAIYLQSHPSAAPPEVIGAIHNAATVGQVSDAGFGSPTALLYSDLTSASPIPWPPISEPISSPISSPISAPISGPFVGVFTSDTTIELRASLSVGALSGFSSPVSKGWTATATIVAWDQDHHPVAGATVNGGFTVGGTRLSCVTGQNGSCAIASGLITTRNTSTTFTVQGLSQRGLRYVSSMNAKTSIAIAKPAI